MYKSIITSEHDKYVQSRIDSIQKSCKTIIQLCQDLKSPAHSEYANQLADLISKFNVPNLYERDDNIEFLRQILSRITRTGFVQQSSGELLAGKKDPRSNTMQAIISTKNQMNSVIEELQYLVSIKIKDTAINNINDGIAEANKDLVQVKADILKAIGKTNTLENSVSQELVKAEQEFEKFRKFIEEKTSTTKELIGMVASEKITKEYLTKSQNEKRDADTFRNYSIIALLTTSVIVLLTLLLFLTSSVLSILPPQYTANLAFSQLKIPNTIFLLTFLLLIPAAYFARESTKHRKLEEINLKTSNDLKSFLPFIESLPDAEKLRIKSILAIGIFTNKFESTVNEDNVPVSSAEAAIRVAERLLNSNKPAS